MLVTANDGSVVRLCYRLVELRNKVQELKAESQQVSEQLKAVTPKGNLTVVLADLGVAVAIKHHEKEFNAMITKLYVEPQP